MPSSERALQAVDLCSSHPFQASRVCPGSESGKHYRGGCAGRGVRVKRPIDLGHETRNQFASHIDGEVVNFRLLAMQTGLDSNRLCDRPGTQRRRKNDDLWFVLDSNGHPNGRGIVYISAQINRFRAHIDERYGTADQPAIPWFNGQSWSFNTSVVSR